jgi:hypothetical protein
LAAAAAAPWCGQDMMQQALLQRQRQQQAVMQQALLQHQR